MRYEMACIDEEIEFPNLEVCHQLPLFAGINNESSFVVSAGACLIMIVAWIPSSVECSTTNQSKVEEC